MKSHLRFLQVHPRPEGRKTDIWEVMTLDGGCTLGLIKWIPSWRKYAFYPECSTIFDSGCLTEITEFINSKMEERKKQKSL